MSLLKTLLVLVIFAGSAAAIIIGGVSLSEGQYRKDMSEQIQAVLLVVVGVIGMFYLASSLKLV